MILMIIPLSPCKKKMYSSTASKISVVHIIHPATGDMKKIEDNLKTGDLYCSNGKLFFSDEGSRDLIIRSYDNKILKSYKNTVGITIDKDTIKIYRDGAIDSYTSK